ncbi:GNAT family N-acetyltransferase [Phenylobacterium sp. 20VBR1]|uniref:GNAT family N-acetyltransferase n=1 Tax=Phenylobacterium glaciei TaxID=2803784 RepID=A0A941CYX5_9CAUL|nr:GNAT family N-acetyltransferase [Phenylobacterium glaciei]MBR7618882.1 GNAT family N-acetyltransferase [Phenylobacterium glaciei]QQZ51258.1 GNAT family N-acetyltransferase [Phenylobacterium glaciei]
MSDILIRAREPADLADMTELLNQPRAIWGTLQMPFVSLEARQKRAAAGSPGDLHLVAVIDGKVIGSASLNRFENRRVHAGSIGMAVHDAYAGRGAGTALMAGLVGQADNWLNLKRLELNVWSDNSRAIALYERFGFEREGLFRNYAWRDGAYADSVAMARLRP